MRFFYCFLVLIFSLLNSGQAIAQISQKKAIIMAENSIREGLKDPYSARFTIEFTHSTPPNGYFVCGNYNSKNSFGAYAGKSSFIVIIDNGAVLTSDSDFSAELDMVGGCKGFYDSSLNKK